MKRKHITAIGLFTAIGAGSVAIIISLAGSPNESDTSVFLRCAALAGAFVGLWVANRLSSREPRHIVGLGAAAGVLLHPVLWFIYICQRSIRTELAIGEYFTAWLDVFGYSLASLPQGGAVTIPLSLAGAWLVSRQIPTQPTNDDGVLSNQDQASPQESDSPPSEQDR